MNPRLNREFFSEQINKMNNQGDLDARRRSVNTAYSNFKNRFGKEAIESLANEDLIELFFQTENYNQESLYVTLCFKDSLPVSLTTIPPYLVGAAFVSGRGWLNPRQKSIRHNDVLRIANVIKTFIVDVSNIVDRNVGNIYDDIDVKLNNLFTAIECKSKSFYGKCLGCLFPNLFPPFYNDGWQKLVLDDEYNATNYCDNFRKMKSIADSFGLDSWTFGECIWSDDEMRAIAEKNPLVDKKAEILSNSLEAGVYSLQELFEKGILKNRTIDRLEQTLRKIADAHSDCFDFDRKNKVLTVKETPNRVLNNVIEQTIETDSNATNSFDKIPNNQLYYGIPGCGKSFKVDEYINNELGISKDDKKKIRTTFFLDYSYCDFVGQLMPQSGSSGIEYKINAGPFTMALALAYQLYKDNSPVVLIIEEINRGNAPAIFGDIFQLLDRNNGGESEYGIINPIISQYLAENGIANPFGEKIKFPKNLWIFATMNSSDQNVFKLDTAFKRRWNMIRMTNESTRNAAVTLNNFYVPGTQTTWVEFVDRVNGILLDNDLNEDRQLGYWFLNKKSLNSLTEDEQKACFANKVLEYLWNDVLKFHDKVLFGSEIKSFDDLVTEYLKTPESVFAEGIMNEHADTSED